MGWVLLGLDDWFLLKVLSIDIENPIKFTNQPIGIRGFSWNFLFILSLLKRILDILRDFRNFQLEKCYKLSWIKKSLSLILINSNYEIQLFCWSTTAGQSVQIPRHSQSRAKSAHLLPTPSKYYHTFKRINM